MSITSFVSPHVLRAPFLDRTTSILDDALTAFAMGSDGVAAELVETLDELVTEAGPHAISVMTETVRTHPIHRLLLEDPYTARAFHKPRGYAGDAVMLDYVYDGTPPARTSPVGRAVFATTTICSTARSVVARRDLLAARIDATAARAPNARILSLACGHLRELARTDAFRHHELGAVYAIDQDPESLACVEASYGDRVTTMRESVGALLRGRVSLHEIDLAYAAGLLDYLDDSTTVALLDVLLATLRPGGELLVANFVKSHHARGYMQLAMDWVLVRRDAEDLARLAAATRLASQHNTRVWTDDEGNVAYLEMRRR